MTFDLEEEIRKYNGDVLYQAIKNTEICVFLYYPERKAIEVPEKACKKYHCKSEYVDMPGSFAEDFVHQDDISAFFDMYRRIDQGAKTSTTWFHNKDASACCHVTLTVLEKKEGDEEKRVLGVIEDVSEWDQDKKRISIFEEELQDKDCDRFSEARELISSAVGRQYYALYHIWLNSRTYICYQEQLPGILSLIGEQGDYEPAWDTYINNYIVAEDQDGMRRFADIETLGERLKNNGTLTHEYRRKNVGWTRGSFIVAKRDDAGNATNVIYTVTDINNEKTMEQAQDQAIFDAHHDPLTKVLNRKGFEEAVRDADLKKIPIAFAIVDVDNFKVINDAFGHETGDRVLCELAQLFSDMFRANDSVFRLGGDEFAVLLRNCPTSAWGTLCEKHKRIHMALDESFKDMTITLSSGCCFSNSGYSEEVFRLADECLYETKHNGRAGCCMCELETGIRNHWKDDTVSRRSHSILSYNNTGLYRIEYPLDPADPPRLFCGELTRELFGFDAEMDPVTCYSVWRSRIDPAYREVMSETRSIMFEGVQAECTYLWSHPQQGSILIRTGGYGELKDGVQILHGYHHSMQNTRIMERRDDQQKILDSISAIYFCSYYIDLENDCYYTLKNAPGEKYLVMQQDKASSTMRHYISSLVSKEDLEKMSIFIDFSTLSSRMEGEVHLDCEYLSVTDKGYCRATFFPVKKDGQGRVTHVLFVITSLDEQKSIEARQNREDHKSVESLYNNVPGGIAMYEWNGKKLKTLHLSSYYEKEYGYTLNSGTGEDRGPDYRRVHPADVVDYQKAIYTALSETHELHYEYRIWNKSLNTYLWTHIDATSAVQPDGTSLVYALYTDVTKQKVIEESLKKSQESMMTALGASSLLAYEYDPITHTGTCFTEHNFFNLPTVILNYPDSLKNIDLFHPEDADLFISTAHRMDENCSEAVCDVRIRKNGMYNWYTCAFHSYMDAVKGHEVAILTVLDINDRKTLMEDYESRLNAALSMVEHPLVIGQSNLTRNTIVSFEAEDSFLPYVKDVKTFDERILRIIPYVQGKDKQEEMRALFSRDHLLALAEEGKSQVRMEYVFRTPDSASMWLETGVYLVRNPINNEVTAISYSRNVQDSRVAALLLKKTMDQDLNQLVFVFMDTDDYYLVSRESHENGQCQRDFWNRLVAAVRPLQCEEDPQFIKNIRKNTVLAALAEQSEYVITFDSTYFGKEGRLQLRFTYLDQTGSLLMVSLRNHTDEELMRKLRHDSEHDPLTDLLNRRTFFRRCRGLLEEHPQDQFVMVHVDMRHFRLFNTFFGDEEGDRLLCDIADMLRSMDQDYDYWCYARIEADVFAAFFPYDEKKYMRHMEQAFAYLKDYRKDFLIEPTIGLYFVEDRSMPIEAMFTRATLAAKSVTPESPYATVIYDEKLERALTQQQFILNDMQTALEEEQFEVYLQPKYNLRNNRPVGAEALVRWMHPQKGMISPGVFIPVFESNGFIMALDHYMWEHVCMILARWKKEGRPLSPISVNVSRLSMFSADTVDFLKAVTLKYEIDPQYLELELTESAYIDDPKEMKAAMHRLQEYGFKILLDDFGSGYSSLNTLRELPVNVLKLDMKFLSLEDQDTRGGLVLSSIVRMSKLLDLVVIAEGVELQEQADFLKGIGVEMVQGYLFARPMPVADYEKIILSEKDHRTDVNTPMIGHIGKILAESGSGTYAMGTVIPAPLACLEYRDRVYRFLRVNPEFFRTFDLDEDLRPASVIFHEHLSCEDNDRLCDAFEKAIDTGVKTSARIIWHNMDHETEFIASIAYEGEISGASSIIVVFTQIPD